MLNGDVDFARALWSHCPCFDDGDVPSGSCSSLSMVKKWIGPRTKS